MKKPSLNQGWFFVGKKWEQRAKLCRYGKCFCCRIFETNKKPMA